MSEPAEQPTGTPPASDRFLWSDGDVEWED